MTQARAKAVAERFGIDYACDFGDCTAVLPTARALTFHLHIHNSAIAPHCWSTYSVEPEAWLNFFELFYNSMRALVGRFVRRLWLHYLSVIFKKPLA
ncbi:hypothetical protein EXIGLDRAFT_720202, partial [Exidia glandulosa HHB12029]